MRHFLLILLTLVLLPQLAHAQIFVTEYNITYTLGENDYAVEEVLKLKNIGNIFVFPDQIELVRGDASEMRAYSDLYGSSFSVDYDYPTRFVLSLQKAMVLKETLLVLKYKRDEGLLRKDKIRLFKFPDIGTYPWGRWEDCISNFNLCLYKANIKISAPEGYQFGTTSPAGSVIRENNSETLSFVLTPLENITIISTGFPVSLEYADYNALAVSELNSAKSLISQSSFTINDANLTLINAGFYVEDETRASSILEEAVGLNENANLAFKEGELLLESPDRTYYEAYLSGLNAIDLAKQASSKAAEAKNSANREIQNALENRITDLASNLTLEQLLRENITKTLVENLSQKIEAVERTEPVEVVIPPPPTLPPEGRNYYELGFFVLLGGLVLYGVANLVLFIRGEESRARGSVSDYRVIGDLKRKSFKGFERKVDTVKQEVDLASEIRRLRKDREKYVLGIENLKKKKLSGEVKKKAFTTEKKKFEADIAEIDTRLEDLEAQLKEMKEKGADEAGKAD